MTERTKPPFRADHVGSLLRPPELLRAREEHARGRVDDAELRAIEDEAIREIVRKQEEVGLRSATDGEFRRASWHMDFIYRLGGVTKAPGHLAVKFRNPSGTIEFTPAALRIDGKLVPLKTAPKTQPWQVPPLTDRGAAHVAAERIRTVMWTHVAITRTAKGLRTALADLTDIEQRLPTGATEELNLVQTARLIVDAALRRKESRGGHYRSDFPRAKRTWRGRHIEL